MPTGITAPTLQAWHRTHTGLACLRRYLHRLVHGNNTHRIIRFQLSEQPLSVPFALFHALKLRLLLLHLPLLLLVRHAIWPRLLRPRLHLLLPSFWTLPFPSPSSPSYFLLLALPFPH